MEFPQLSHLEAIQVLKPLLIFIMAVSLYAIFVFKFYRFLSRRDILQLKPRKTQLRATSLLEKGYLLFHLLRELSNRFSSTGVLLVPRSHNLAYHDNQRPGA